MRDRLLLDWGDTRVWSRRSCGEQTIGAEVFSNVEGNVHIPVQSYTIRGIEEGALKYRQVEIRFLVVAEVLHLGRRYL